MQDEKGERRERIAQRLSDPAFKFDPGDCWAFITKDNPAADPFRLARKIEQDVEKFAQVIEDTLTRDVDQALRGIVAWWGDTLEEDSYVLLGSGERRGKLVVHSYSLPSGKPGADDMPIAVFSSLRDAVNGVVAGSGFSDFSKDDAEWWAQHFRDCAKALDQMAGTKAKGEDNAR